MRRALLLLALAACAPRTPAPGPAPAAATPEQVAALEARHAANPADPVAGIELGLAYESIADHTRALSLYRDALGKRLTREQKQTLETRIAVLTRLVLAEDAKRAVAAEATLSARTPEPNTVAVLPWIYLGADPELKPLERGLAHLVLADLAKVSRLTLLERQRVQAIADEIALGGTGRVDSGSAARSGRLLGASDVLQGVINDGGAGQIRLQANVVRASNAEIRATGTSTDRLNQLFAMEKALVMDLLDRWGVSITPAERRAIAEQPTADLQAFLAFSRGLEAEDRGDFMRAGVSFREAVTRDPGFAAARVRADAAPRGANAPAGVTRAELAAAVAKRPPPGVRGLQLGAALQTIAPTMAARFAKAGPRQQLILRSRLAEALRQDDASRLGDIATTTQLPRP